MFNSTFAIIKPHILERGIEDEVLAFVLAKCFIVRRLETRIISEEEAKALYKEHNEQEFYEALCQSMCEGPCIIMELTRMSSGSKEECWKQWRDFIGATDPSEAIHQTLRGLFGISRQYNAVHGSDSRKSAIRELDIFFKGKNKIINN